MKAICIQARADSIVPSKSFANLRERLIQPRVRSGTSNLDGVAASVRRAIGAGLGGPGL
jgi:hypothetical protein